MTDRLTPAVTDRLLIMYGILLQHLFLCYSSGVQSITGFYMANVNVFVTELNNNSGEDMGKSLLSCLFDSRCI